MMVFTGIVQGTAANWYRLMKTQLSHPCGDVTGLHAGGAGDGGVGSITDAVSDGD